MTPGYISRARGRLSSMHLSAHGSTLGGFRAEAMSSVPSSCALCAQPLGHCLCVPPRGGSAAQAAGLGEPSGAPTTLELEARRPHRPHTDAACVPLSARRCERARRERSRRRRLDGRPAGARRRRHLRPPRPLHRPPRPPDLRPKRRRHVVDAPGALRPLQRLHAASGVRTRPGRSVVRVERSGVRRLLAWLP